MSGPTDGKIEELFPEMSRFDLVLWRAWDWKVGIERTDDQRRADWKVVMTGRRVNG